MQTGLISFHRVLFLCFSPPMHFQSSNACVMMHGLYVHRQLSTFACKCGVHRIFVIWISIVDQVGLAELRSNIDIASFGLPPGTHFLFLKCYFGCLSAIKMPFFYETSNHVFQPDAMLRKRKRVPCGSPNQGNVYIQYLFMATYLTTTEISICLDYRGLHRSKTSSVRKIHNILGHMSIVNFTANTITEA